MTSRVSTVDAVGEDRDGVATCREGGLVRSTFDPVGAASDDHSFIRGRRSGEFAGNMVAVGSGCA